MIKSLFIIIALGVPSFIYTDIQSSSAFYSIMLPLIVFSTLVSLAFWFVTLFHKLGVNQTTSSSSGDSSGFGGFDGGGGDGGC